MIKSFLSGTPNKIVHPSVTTSPDSNPDYTLEYLHCFSSVAEAADSTLVPNPDLLASHGIRLSR